jgi:hypothetical protein
MSVVAAIVQFTGADSLAAQAAIGVAYVVFDDAVPRTAQFQVEPIAGLTYANRGSWKDLLVQSVVDHAATQGFTLTAANVNWIPFEPGDSKPTYFAAGWTKDITKTNIGSAAVNVYVGAAGEGQLVTFARYNQYRLAVWGNKVGTGNLTAQLAEVATPTNVLAVTYTGAAGEFVQDSGWLNLPAWANGETNLKPMALSSVATDDPIFRQFALYLR